MGEVNERVPINEFVARFLGYENVFHVRFLKHEKGTSEVSTAGVTIRLAGLLESQEATVAIRPEDIVIAEKSLSAGGDWNLLEGNIRKYTNLGPIVEVTVDAGLVIKVLMHKRSFLGSHLSEGTHVQVGFRTNSVKIVSMP
jgi:ABC-type Fe3+/spermidine/putrescine transport system ATPase subunit